LFTFKFGHTQIFKDQLPYSDSVELQNLYHQALLIQDSFYQSGTTTQLLDIFEVENGKYLVIDGRFSLFAWRNGLWSIFPNQSIMDITICRRNSLSIIQFTLLEDMDSGESMEIL
jgi:hypothetical protein